MAKKKCKIGPVAYIFWIGLILALILAIANLTKAAWATNEWLLFLLVIIGIIVGFMKWKTKNVTELFIAVIVLVGTSILLNLSNTSTSILLIEYPVLMQINTLIPYVGTFLTKFIEYIVYLVVPATLIIASKHIWLYFTE